MARTALLGVVIACVLGASLLYDGTSVGPRTGGSRSLTVATESTSVPGSPLQLRLSVNAFHNATMLVSVEEYNPGSAQANVSVASLWKVNGLALGPCGRSVYPFGISVLRGAYTAANVSRGVPLQIYPPAACPLFVRLIAGYAFQPENDSAVVLPVTGSDQATPMSANITVAFVYGQDASLQMVGPLGPGTYTVVAGDEWGALLMVHVTIQDPDDSG